MKKAFTLIELLVVIAIIAILAAILFPVFAQAKEAAKKTSCLSNAKQMATATYLYMTDYDDLLCQVSWEKSATPQPFNNGGYQIHWTYLMQPYIKNWQIFVCPSDSDPVTPKHPCPSEADFGKLDSSGQMYCDWEALKYSYLPNYNVMPAHDWLPVSTTSLPEPASTISITERRAVMDSGYVVGKHKGISGFNPSQPCPGSVQVAPQFDLIHSMNFAYWTPEYAIQHNKLDASDKADIVRLKWDRHAGGANFAYADGHAKFRKLPQILNPDNYEFGDHFYPSYAPYNGDVCTN